MKIFGQFLTVNISKLYFCLVINIAKNLIWTTLKAILSVFGFFLHPQIIYFQIVSRPKLIYSSFKLCVNLNFEKLTLKTGFMVQGHIYI